MNFVCNKTKPYEIEILILIITKKLPVSSVPSSHGDQSSGIARIIAAPVGWAFAARRSAQLSHPPAEQ